MDEIIVASICKALSDPNRLKIIRILTNGELCACQLLEELNINHSTLSHHMKVLADCNLVHVRRNSKWSYYSLNCETLSAYREYIGSLVCCSTRGCCR